MGTFHGLQLAKQALYAQQAALYTTGHNIANVNTKGYSRQRVNFQTTPAIPVPSRVMGHNSGQIGTGVEIGTVQRIRNQFLDSQFREENSKLGYWNAKLNVLTRMESLLNEPTETGLSEVMGQFWQSLQDLAVHPENSGARSVVAENGLAMTETFNYFANSIQSNRQDIEKQMKNNVDTVNSLLGEINQINEQIRKIEPHGYLANDLYDERDRLVDELSHVINIKVTHHESSESSPKIADGLMAIELIDMEGKSFNPPIMLIDIENAPTLSEAVNEIELIVNDAGVVSSITVADSTENKLADFLSSTGSLKGLIEAYGYINANNEVEGVYPEMMAKLDQMANAFAAAFNSVHEAGKGLNDETGIPFFVASNGSAEITAANMTVNPEIMKNPSLIAANFADSETGDGENALKLADVFNDPLQQLDDDSVRDYFTSIIGKLGVDTREANRMKHNVNILQAQVDRERQSVSAVSLDEEMTNLIQFQHAYNAAARNITAIDEMIDRIINHMGLVGR